MWWLSVCKRQNRDFKLTAVQVAFLSTSFVSLRNAPKSGKITILFDVIMGSMLHVILTQKVVIQSPLGETWFLRHSLRQHQCSQHGNHINWPRILKKELFQKLCFGALMPRRMLIMLYYWIRAFLDLFIYFYFSNFLRARFQVIYILCFASFLFFSPSWF